MSRYFAAPVLSLAPPPSASYEPRPAPLQPRTVGSSVNIVVTPPAAAERAVVKVDGLVRGPAASLFTRFRSRQDHSFAEKLLSAMRFQFGGHVERPSGG